MKKETGRPERHFSPSWMETLVMLMANMAGAGVVNSDLVRAFLGCQLETANMG